MQDALQLRELKFINFNQENNKDRHNEAYQYLKNNLIPSRLLLTAHGNTKLFENKILYKVKFY